MLPQKQQTKPGTKPIGTAGLPVKPGQASKPTATRTPLNGGVAVRRPPMPAGGTMPIPPGTSPQVAELAQNPAFQAHVLGGGKPLDGPLQGGPGAAPDQAGYGPGDPMNKPLPAGPVGAQGIPGRGPSNGMLPIAPTVEYQAPAAPSGGPPPGADQLTHLTGGGLQAPPPNVFQDPATLAMVRRNLQMASQRGGGTIRPEGWTPGQAY